MAKGYYSPLTQTFGSRPDDFSYTAGADFKKSHIKLNHKLVKLRQYCDVLNKDTKKYDNSKLSKISSETYAAENKLQGALILHLIERDLVYVENLRLNHRVSKKNQRVITRLKKASKYASFLQKIIKKESVWQTKLEYLIYCELANIEYYSTSYNNGNNKKLSKKNGVTEKDLVTKFVSVLMGLDLLLQDKMQKNKDGNNAEFLQIIETIKNKYRFLPLDSTIKGKQDIIAMLTSASSDDEPVDGETSILSILNLKEYTPNIHFLGLTSNALKNKEYVKSIEWRSFTADVKNEEVAKYLTVALQLQSQKKIKGGKKTKNHETPNNPSQNGSSENKFDDMLLNYNLAEETHLKSMDSEDNDDQILSTFINYNKLFVMIQRDSELFENLLRDWEKKSKSSTELSSTHDSEIKDTYSKLERVVNNLDANLTQVTTLPGVYSDDDLLATLRLSIQYYKSSLCANCLAPLYKKAGKYVESMGLLAHSLSLLSQDSGNTFSELPGDIVTQEVLTKLQKFIEQSCLNVQALALYQQKLRSKTAENVKYNNSITVVESGFRLAPAMIEVNNLFPLKPIVKPVMAKPTLFDLAYNYIDFENRVHQNLDQEMAEDVEIASTSADETATRAPEPEKKKGFLGFFRG